MANKEEYKSKLVEVGTMVHKEHHEGIVNGCTKEPCATILKFLEENKDDF